MAKSTFKTVCWRLLTLACLVLLLYGIGRAYYHITDGFLESNIQYELPHDPRWTTKSLTASEKTEMAQILSQKFYYLGKGCQSYVFRSEDNRYVIKFFKYQRFKPQAWLDYFAFIPVVDEYRLDKIEKKKQKLAHAFSSWKLAYQELPRETGVLYVHFNKTPEWNKSLIAYDKIGIEHQLPLDSLEFMVQKKASMLCPELLKQKNAGNLAEAQQLFDHLLALLLGEYARGYADNDHALMQNTGVFEGQPIHIDVGQFVKNPIASDPKIYHQELFNKMWKFRRWLRSHYPELAAHADKKLREAIGPSFETLTPQLNKASMGRIPYIISY